MKFIVVFLVLSAAIVTVKVNLTASTKPFRKFLRKEAYGIIIKLLTKKDK